MKILSWILGIVVIAGLIYWIISSKTPGQVNNLPISQNTETTNSLTPVGSTTSTFTNTQFKYSFGYNPTTDTLNPTDLAKVAVADSSSGYWKFNVESSTGETKALVALGQDLYNQNKPPVQTDGYTVSDMVLSDISVDGVAAKELVIDWKKYGDLHNTWIVVKKGDTVYYLSGTPTAIQQLLGSFKFI